MTMAKEFKLEFSSSSFRPCKYRNLGEKIKSEVEEATNFPKTEINFAARSPKEELKSESSSYNLRPRKCQKLVEKIKSEATNFPGTEINCVAARSPKHEFDTANIVKQENEFDTTNMVKQEVDCEDCNDSTSSQDSISPFQNDDDDDIHFTFINPKPQIQYLADLYMILKCTHHGSSANVIKCVDPSVCRTCSIKVFHGTEMFSEKASKEIQILQMLAKHDHTGKHFVSMFNSAKHSNHTCVVLEELGPSLHQHLVEHPLHRKFSLDAIYQLGRQMLESVALMHDLHLIHTDLKPHHLLFASPTYVQMPIYKRGSNVFLYMKRFPVPFALKVIDFTSTISEDQEYHCDIVSTRQYRAPEVILGLGWSYPCDVWSVGCILAELYSGRILFSRTNDDDLQHLAMMETVLGKFPSHMLENTLHPAGKKFNNGRLNFPENITKAVMGLRPVQELVRSHVSGYEADFINLLQGLLKCDPSERLTARDALQHPFFY